MSRKYNKSIIVAVIDTGIDYMHKDLKDVMWKNIYEIPKDGIDNDNNGYIDDNNGWNFVKDSFEVLEGEELYENDHGTQCAGIISGMSKRKTPSNDGLQIMSLKVLGGLEKQGNLQNVIKAVQYAEDNGAKICNLSIDLSMNLSKVKNYLSESDMLFVIAAGNDGIDIDEYGIELCTDNVIIVCNVDEHGNLFRGSNYGKNTVDIGALGVDINSTVVDGYDTGTGTSMSAALVSGVCASIMMERNDYSAVDVKKAILSLCSRTESLKDKVKYGVLCENYN